MFKNWFTTMTGLLAAIGGFPVALAALGYSINKTAALCMAICGLVGVALLGLGAKGADQHSTQAQTAASTATVTGLPNASALVKQADAQVKAAGQ